MKRTLEMTVIEGIKTSIPLHLKVLNDPRFRGWPREHVLYGALHSGPAVGAPRRGGLSLVPLPSLYVICDADACERHGWSLTDFASACLDGGATLLQLRVKRGSSRAFRRHRTHPAAGGRTRHDHRQRPRRYRAAGGCPRRPRRPGRSAAGRRACAGRPRCAHRIVDAHARTTRRGGARACAICRPSVRSTARAARTPDTTRSAPTRCGWPPRSPVRPGMPVVAIGGITLERAPEVIAGRCDIRVGHLRPLCRWRSGGRHGRFSPGWPAYNRSTFSSNSTKGATSGGFIVPDEVHRSLLSEHDGGEIQLKRTLGPLALVALGIGAIIGAGFVRTAAAIAERSGPSVTLAFMVAASDVRWLACVTRIRVDDSDRQQRLRVLVRRWASWSRGSSAGTSVSMRVGAATVAIAWGVCNKVLEYVGLEVPYQWSHSPFEMAAATASTAS